MNGLMNRKALFLLGPVTGLLIFVGVVGGLIAYGVVGLFIGPVALAVVYRLSEAWVNRGGTLDSPSPPPQSAPGG